MSKMGRAYVDQLERQDYFDGRRDGIREAVEWVEINNRITPQVNENRGANIPREVWQAQKKKWGIGR